MKKTNSFPCYLQSNKRRFKLLALKLTLISFLLFTLQVSASVNSQAKLFDLTLQNVSVKEVFKTIETQSEFRFFYNDELSDVNRLVSVDLKNQKVEEILTQLFDKTSVTYKVLDNNLIVITPTGLMAQNQKVSGTITDGISGEPLPGVNVSLEGTTLGTITDVSGKYTLDVPSTSAVLLFSFVGYNTERVEIAGRTVVDFNLIPDIKNLKEVVVIGYGTSTKATVTGSISTLEGNELQSVPTINVTNSLAGKLPGLVAVNRSGEPGMMALYYRSEVQIRLEIILR